jgi:predicted dehydrogenase
MPADADSPALRSRRDFLVHSAAVVAGSGLAAAAAPARARERDRVLRVGLIGCGGRGTGAAAQALSTSGPVELVAMGDAFADRVAESREHLGKSRVKDRVKVDAARCFVGFDAFEKVLDAGVDVVLLATPPHFRPAQFAAAVEHGVHVFMEKPVAVDAPGVRQVLAAGAAAAQKNLAVGVGLQRRHQRRYLETMRRVHEGAIGDVVAARCYWNMGSLWHKEKEAGWTEMEWQMRNWLYFTWLSGDHIVEQHIHNIDVVNWAKRMHPVRAVGVGGRQVRTAKEFGHIFDHHSVHFEYADGSWLFSQCRQIPGCWNSVSEHLIGTSGRAECHDGKILARNGDVVWEFEDGERDPFQQEHDDLFAAIRAGAPYNEAQHGAESTLTAVMGRMATYTGREVTWEQALASEERLGPPRYEWGEAPFPPVAMPGA